MHFVYFYDSLMKVAQHKLKSGFFLSRLHIGWDWVILEIIQIPPPPPYGWQAGNPDGRGGQEGLEIRVGLGYRLENSSGVIFDV